MFQMSTLVHSVFFIIFILINNCKCKPVDKNKIMTYLNHFGYAKSKNETMYTEGLKNFQRNAGIAITGVMDEQTQQVMAMPRCGLDIPSTQLKGSFQGSRWKPRDITFKVLDYPNNLDKKYVDEVVEKAFNEWSPFANKTFVKVLTGNSDINISFSFRPVMDNMEADFILGTAKYPVFGGNIQFNSVINWDEDGISLYQVALHEIGHSLGLLHSSYPNSIMSPFFNKFDGNIHLHPNDKLKMKLLYDTSTSKKILLRDAPSVCKIDKLDAIISYSENEIYVFSEDKYWVLEAWTDEILFTEKYPKTISSRWKELPGNIDAAYVDIEGNTYFFKGDKYWMYQNTFILLPGYPKNISDGFSGIPSNLDAAMEWEDENIYFFKGAKYWKYDTNKYPKVSAEYPKPISEWGSDVPNNIDAVLYFANFNGQTYFFKDMLYYRYMQPDLLIIRKFPRPTRFWWFNC